MELLYYILVGYKMGLWINSRVSLDGVIAIIDPYSKP